MGEGAVVATVVERAGGPVPATLGHEPTGTSPEAVRADPEPWNAHHDPGPLDLPVTTSYPCRPVGESRAHRHPVIVQADWTLVTGHDEGLERIAAAFGGRVTCLAELPPLTAALRVWWQRARRAGGPALRSRDEGTTWIPGDGRLACCAPSGYRDPGVAAAHFREPRHVAFATGAPRRQLAWLVAGLNGRADPARPDVGDPDAGGRGADGVRLRLGAAATACEVERTALLDEAWACGLNPAWAEQVLGILEPAGPVEVGTLLALAQTGADPRWVAATAQATGDPGALTWLAWTPTELDDGARQARIDWMRTGSRRADITALSRAGYAPTEVETVARAWRISHPTAAQLMARWVARGYRPTGSALATIVEEGIGYPPGPPSPDAVAQAQIALLARGWGPLTERLGSTGVALALARWGAVPRTVAALERQARESFGAGDVRAPG